MLSPFLRAIEVERGRLSPSNAIVDNRNPAYPAYLYPGETVVTEHQTLLLSRALGLGGSLVTGGSFVSS